MTMDFKYNTCKVWKRENGPYEGRITINGKQISKYGHTEKEVRNKLKQLELDYFQNKSMETKVRLEDAIDRYLTKVKKGRVKASTYDRVVCILDNQIRGTSIGRKWLSKVTTDDIQNTLYFYTKTLSKSSVKKIYDLYGEFFKYMVATRQISYNPMSMVRMPHSSSFKYSSKPMQIIEAGDFQRFMRCAAEKKENGEPRFRYGELIILMLLTGLRSGEARAIKLENVDFEQKILFVTEGISKHRTDEIVEEGKHHIEYSVGTLKTEKSKRDIPLCERALASIRHLAETTYNPESGYLITTNTGALLSHTYLQVTFDDILKSAGLAHKGIHALRHTFATYILKDAADKGRIKEVSEMLGHSEVSTTYEYYIKTSNRDKRNLVNNFDSIAV